MLNAYTAVWHHGMVHAVLNTHLPSFDSPIGMEEQRPSVQTLHVQGVGMPDEDLTEDREIRGKQGALPRGVGGAACCCLLKRVAHPWTLKGGVKPQQGKPSSVIKIRTRTELGPSLA